MGRLFSINNFKAWLLKSLVFVRFVSGLYAKQYGGEPRCIHIHMCI